MMRAGGNTPKSSAFGIMPYAVFTATEVMRRNKNMQAPISCFPSLRAASTPSMARNDNKHEEFFVYSWVNAILGGERARLHEYSTGGAGINAL
jgi:hypothetical protein